MPRGGARVGAGRPKGSGKKAGAAGTAPVKPASGKFAPGAPPKSKGAASVAASIKNQPKKADPIETGLQNGQIDPDYTGVSPLITAATSLDYMLEVMQNPYADPARRDRMAVAAAAYMHPKKGEGGKRDGQRGAAQTAGAGKFAPAAAPKLVSSR